MENLRNELYRFVRSKGVNDEHAAWTIVNDTMMKEDYRGREFYKAGKNVQEYYKRRKTEYERNKKNIPLDAPTSEQDILNHTCIGQTDDRIENVLLVERQRQLIAQLLKGESEKTLEVVNAYLALENASLRTVEKETGIPYCTIRRILKRLAKKFDESHGNIEDYFSVSA